ncbi:MAG TPA: hypothetical protein PLL72_06770 [Burkholderiaceae bacterium]|nr:hypothetical protein [Burkholderiaceae bacterium]
MTILEKRTADNRLFDIDCSKLLDADETITAVGTITADGSTGLSFGTGVVNTQTVSYTDDETGLTRAVGIGKVVQVRISQGNIPAGRSGLDCTVRVPLTTSKNTAVEATVLLRLTNKAPA